jgi:endonuclease-3
MKKSNAQTDRIVKVLDLLQASGLEPVPGLEFASPWQLLVATVLSAQCTDVRVNMVTPALFAKWPGTKELAGATQGEVEQMIHSIGLFRNKAKSLVAMAKRLQADFDGEVPGRREVLESLPGVGRKTASVVLAQAFNVPAFAVDTHVGRVCTRLGFSPSPDPKVTETALTAILDSSRWALGHLLLVLHGRRTCKARKPACNSCPVEKLCPWPDKSV